MIFEDIGIKVPSILLPRPDIDLAKWAVVACDQYTSQQEYWEKVLEFVGDCPSTLNMILPEVYLGSDDEGKRISRIEDTMEDYLAEGVLVERGPGFVLVDRSTSRAGSRKGLVVAIDLEKYDFSRGSRSLVRATEGTLLERLPPRIKIRQNALLEMPHIMVLIDDPGHTVIEPLFEKDLEKVYDTELMMDGGHISGYLVENPCDLEDVASALRKLADPSTFDGKYGVRNEDVLLYAMGDGNHSLATAKVIWENIKKEADGPVEDHPARYALVELVNVHDEGLEFEPIHRVLFNVDTDAMLNDMEAFFTAQGSSFSFGRQPDEPGVHCIPMISGETSGTICIRQPKLNLEAATLQSFLDGYLESHKEVTIDYIHGEDVVSELGSKQSNAGFFLPAMSKHDLFKTIILDGALPRKTFSMGHAEEKRFYLECRKVRP